VLGTTSCLSKAIRGATQSLAQSVMCLRFFTVPVTLALAIASGCRSPADESRRSIPTAVPPSLPVGPPEFIENDYAAARQAALEQGLPLFVDAWAPWCHTCVSLKAFVFPDAALRRVVPKFVWASVDTEHPSSRAFVERFPMEVWPTLWVIEPKTERPVLKWAGAATAPDLAALLGATAASVESRDPRAAEAWAAWLAGNEHVASGDRSRGIAAYDKALALAPEAFPGRAHVLEALVFQLRRAEEFASCIERAAAFDTLPRGTSRLNVVLTGLGCSNQLADSHATEATKATLARLVAEATRVVTDTTEPVLADDRSSLYQELVFQHERAGDTAQSKAMAAKWSAFLDDQAARATSADARVVFDYHRLLAYEACDELARAVPMLEQSERDFPNDYNAPSRLANVYYDLGQFDLALAAVDRANARVYGPRKLRVLRQKAEILAAMKQPDRAKVVLSEAVALGRGLGPLPEGYVRLLADLERRLAENAVKSP
jgi:tetratricopeptide (TPR) repeat protein